ncbi:MAG: MBL fold metallo-hydrolase [Cognatishimia sp.]
MRRNHSILVDCGEGAFRQLMLAGIDLRHVDEIFLSHHHFDHIGSLFAGLGVNMMLHRRTPLAIYGPPGTREFVGHLIRAYDFPHSIGFGVAGQTLMHPRDFVAVQDVVPGDQIEVGDIRVTFCENTHYRSEDKFSEEGPISQSLRFDTPDRSMVFTDDTGPCKALEAFTYGADLLVGELIDVDRVVKRMGKQHPDLPAEEIEMSLGSIGCTN